MFSNLKKKTLKQTNAEESHVSSPITSMKTKMQIDRLALVFAVEVRVGLALGRDVKGRGWRILPAIPLRQSWLARSGAGNW